jgi:tetratricopeptide (TPR) repeat protein
MLKNLLMNLLRAPAKARHARSEQSALLKLGPATAAFNAKQYKEVVKLCKAVIAEEPKSARAHHLCARALMQMGCLDDAESYLRIATEADPDLAEAHADFATVKFGFKDYPGAEECARQAIALQGREIRYRLLLVDILEAAGQGRDALAELSVAYEYAPERLDVLVRLSQDLDRLCLYTEMLSVAERAMAEVGEKFETLLCLAVARYATNDMEGAVTASRKALKCSADQPRVYVTLGSALFALGRAEESLAAYKRALKLSPGYADAQFHIGLVNLMQRKYSEGWQGFEARFQTEQYRNYPVCNPRWNGTSLRGRTLLIRREQGLGDEIMYASCFQQIIDDAQECFIECEPRLEKLFSRSFPRATVFCTTNDDRKLPQSIPEAAIDTQVYAASLPRYLRNSLRDFPDHAGYLVADPGRVQHWQAQLATLGAGLKVGISWRGGTALTHTGRRSLTLETLLPVLAVPGVHWVNLQYGNRADEIVAFERANGIQITDWSDALDGDYDETAALVETLDLVISVCTSVVHLAGALGKPVWVMAPFVPEWRYGLQGEGMPWYPTARLIRQPGRGNWEAVIGAVEHRLQRRVMGEQQ